MQPIRWAIVTSLAVALLSVACSSDDTTTDAPPTTGTTAATATSAPTSAATPAAATAAAKTAPALSTPGADGTVQATISGGKLPTLAVKVGSVVAFVNQDAFAHTATSDDGSTFDSQSLAPSGGTFKFTASKAGTFTYACSIHPDMKGSITVQ